MKIKLFSTVLMACLLVGCSSGCKSHLEQGGAYNPSVTNVATGEVTSAPKDVLYTLDASYKFAYGVVAGGLKLEMDNRESVAALSPEVKPALDKVRNVVWEIDQKWATARKAYKDNPNEEGLANLKGVLSELEKIVPIVQDALTPYIQKLSESK